MRTAGMFLVMILAAVSLDAAPYRVLSWDMGSVTVEIVSGPARIIPLDREGDEGLSRVELAGFPSSAGEPGLPLLPVRRLLFRVPSDSGVRLDIVDRDIVPLEGITPEFARADDGARHADAASERSATGDFVTLNPIERYRGG